MMNILPPINIDLGIDYLSMIFIVSTLLIIIHFAFVALTYMASKILSNNSLEGFSKHELQQAVFSIIILGSIFSGILIVNNLFCISLVSTGIVDAHGSCRIPDSFSFVGLNGATHINVARTRLAMFYNDVRVLAKGALRAYDWTDFFGTLRLTTGLMRTSVPVISSSSAVHAIIYSECFDILSHVLIFIKFQELFLFLNAIYFFPPFFYLGMVLRILPFTRKLGGLLLGITLGLFFVLPYFYIMGSIVLESTPGFGTRYIVDTSSYVFTFFSPNVMGGTGELETVDFSEIAREKFFEEREGDDPQIGRDISVDVIRDRYLDDASDTGYDEELQTNVGVAQARYDDSKSLYGDSIDYLTKANNRKNHSFVEIVSRVVLSTVFITVFALVGTIAAIKEISRFFGGDIEIAGLTRLI